MLILCHFPSVFFFFSFTFVHAFHFQPLGLMLIVMRRVKRCLKCVQFTKHLSASFAYPYRCIYIWRLVDVICIRKTLCLCLPMSATMEKDRDRWKEKEKEKSKSDGCCLRLSLSSMSLCLFDWRISHHCLVYFPTSIYNRNHSFAFNLGRGARKT